MAGTQQTVCHLHPISPFLNPIPPSSSTRQKHPLGPYGVLSCTWPLPPTARGHGDSGSATPKIFPQS